MSIYPLPRNLYTVHFPFPNKTIRLTCESGTSDGCADVLKKDELMQRSLFLLQDMEIVSEFIHIN